MTRLLVDSTSFRSSITLGTILNEMNLRLRVVLLTLLCVTLALPAIADEKKAGAQLEQRGITAYVIKRAAPKQLELQLRAKELPVASVIIDVLSEDDQIVKYEPVAGEVFVVESLMSKSEITFRTEHESVTARFDLKAMEWKRTGSEALFARMMPNADIVSALLTELAERGILRTPELAAR